MKFDFLKYIFSPIFDMDVNELSSKDVKGVRHIVSRYSRGNVSLQKGRYSVESEINQRRKKICNYRFE